MKTVTYRILVAVLLIVAVGTLGYLTRQFASLDWLAENETKLRAFVQQHWISSWAIGLAIYTVLSVIPGTVGKSIVVGWLFGFWAAVLLVDLGLTIAAIVGFTASRFIFRDIVKARFGKLIEKLDHGLEREGAFYLLMTRLANLPYSFVNYAAGTTTVSLVKFSWTTLVGILPSAMVFVFVGTRIPSLAKISAEGVWLLLDPVLWGVLVGVGVFPLLIRWAIGKFYQRPDTISSECS